MKTGSICRTSWVTTTGLLALFVVGSGCIEKDSAQSGTLSTADLANIDARIARVDKAEADLAKGNEKLAAADKAVKDNPKDLDLPKKASEAKEAVESAERKLKVERSVLARLLQQTGSWESLASSFGPAFQYLIFAALGIFVLWKLLHGPLDDSPTTNPQQMITFLIAVTTVSIALIMVLATIVLDSADLKDRFAMAREVLAVLIGVLGTIVGFYFGKSGAVEAKPLEFEPIAIRMDGTQKIALDTSVRGGRGPYHGEVRFDPASIAAATPEVDGSGKLSLKGHSIGAATEFKYFITVTDTDGRKGTKEGSFKVTKTDGVGQQGASPPGNSELVIAEVKVSAKDGKGSLDASLSGGKPSYKYTVKFNPDTINEQKEITGEVGESKKGIHATFDIGAVKEFSYEITVTDSDKKTVSEKGTCKSA